MNLHYGAGLMVGRGWHNCDGSPTLRLQRLPVLGAVFRRFLHPLFPKDVAYGNIVTGLEVEEDSCKAIYCCHVLEHLALEDARAALRNTYRYLETDGLFRIVVPDFEQQVAAYIADQSPGALLDFLGYTHLGRRARPKGLFMRLREVFGNSYHLWIWDYKSLSQELKAIGFREIRRCEFGDCKDPAFQSVESRPRFDWALAS